MGPGFKHVAGDALAFSQVKNCEVVGDLRESILAFCQLSTEWLVSQRGADGMPYITIPAAYHIWRCVEGGVRAYQGYTTMNPGWVATFGPTALKKANRDRLIATQSAIQAGEPSTIASPVEGPLTPLPT